MEAPILVVGKFGTAQSSSAGIAGFSAALIRMRLLNAKAGAGVIRPVVSDHIQAAAIYSRDKPTALVAAYDFSANLLTLTVNRAFWRAAVFRCRMPF